MSNLSRSSAKLSLIIFSSFILISCKNSSSETEQVKDSTTAKDSGVITRSKSLERVKPAVLKIGKSVDYKNQEVLGSSIFSRDDTMFVYYLIHHKRLDVEKLNLRFYRVQEDGADLVESVIIYIDPLENAISDSFELYKVYNEFGKGQYEMQFLHQDSIVAARSFLLL
jgi:hypothetical protein